ncbi:hypothetical protein ES319_A03G087500v1 [Gossypium barbadense]|uniref:Exopolyphosphatase n=2 Tax=Gossypium TaxID=3633 RepID=A0A5J5WF37_GOSBA|nr:hypothetical protein ES319_A03G087500v1 [Gossypium barbadense]TYH24491.1 hypothetical protein ES288_A03G096300v1 [Gossypium darwinii]
MDRRLSRDSSLQKKALENRCKAEADQQHVPDLTDFINDMFFGTVDNDKKAHYNLTGKSTDEEDEDFDSSTRSNSSKLTQEWLEEARRMMASSPSRSDSPFRLVGSPKFAAAQPGRLSLSSSFERRDPLSRSARRNRQLEGFSEEILTKSAKHSRNKSETPDTVNSSSPTDNISATEPVHKWFSNILKPTNHTPPSSGPPSPTRNDLTSSLPPRHSTFRRSRFQADPSARVPVPSSTTLKTQLSLQDTQLVSPPKKLVESAHRRSISSSTSFFEQNKPLSPPRNLVESAQRRSISKSTCSLEKIAPRKSNANGWSKEDDGTREISLNKFLKDQRSKFEMILNGEAGSKAKIVLSGPSNSTSSMVAAICYAWLLDNRGKKSKGGEEEGCIVVPVMNVKRERMWKHRQAAWLFHHVGLDATSLLFAEEVDVETLMMDGQLSILVVGQDILKTNGEVGSQCTILTDNYCEDAYELLQTPMLKKLLLSGILLDTQNLDVYAKLSMARDAEAVQLLLVGSVPNYRNALYDQLMQDERDNSFIEVLQHTYGKPSNDGVDDTVYTMSETKSPSISRRGASATHSDKTSNDARSAKVNKSPSKPAKPGALPVKGGTDSTAEASRGKNKFFLAKWFGFGSK